MLSPRRTTVPLLAAVVVLGLSGCFGVVDFRDTSRSAWSSRAHSAALFKRTFRLTFTSRVTRPGTSRSVPPGRKVTGTVYKGTFKTTQIGPSHRARAAVLKVGKGKWVAKINGQEDFTHGVATE